MVGESIEPLLDLDTPAHHTRPAGKGSGRTMGYRPAPRKHCPVIRKAKKLKKKAQKLKKKAKKLKKLPT